MESKNNKIHNVKVSVNVGDYVELEYVDNKDYYVNTFKGLILEIESFTTDKSRKFYKIKTADGVLDIKDKFIQSMSIVKKSK